MERSEIYEQLTALIPDLKRREPTERVMSESGADFLLDELIKIQYIEGLTKRVKNY